MTAKLTTLGKQLALAALLGGLSCAAAAHELTVAECVEGGDFIIQEVSAKRPRISEYALLHKLADGVFMLWAIDEMDADEQTRAAFCGKGNNKDPAACRVETREQLFAFARATSARQKPDGGLVLLLPEGAEKPKHTHVHRRLPPAH